MNLRRNRVKETEAVNATRSFFESCGCVFQEVDTANDYGKDAYIDLTAGEQVIGLCVALQIKGGEKYRRADGYSIPIDKHFGIWKTSTVPIAGIVYDPQDQALRWCNISEYLNTREELSVHHIPIHKERILTPEILQSTFRQSFESVSRRFADNPFLLLCSKSIDIQVSALFDCFALGRHDSRVFIVLRHLISMLQGEPLQVAIRILSHLTPHPDILWHTNNWVEPHVKSLVQKHFRWTNNEIRLVLSAVPWEEWDRGSLGEDLYMLLLEDPDIQRKVEQVAISALKSGLDAQALTALVLTVYWSGEDGLAKYNELVSKCPDFRRLEMAYELEATLKEDGCVDIF